MWVRTLNSCYLQQKHRGQIMWLSYLAGLDIPYNPHSHLFFSAQGFYCGNSSRNPINFWLVILYVLFNLIYPKFWIFKLLGKFHCSKIQTATNVLQAPLIPGTILFICLYLTHFSNSYPDIKEGHYSDLAATIFPFSKGIAAAATKPMTNYCFFHSVFQSFKSYNGN